MTALRKGVCIYPCLFVGLFEPTTYRKFEMSVFKYFTMMECPHRRVLQTTEQKVDCWVAVKESDSEADLSVKKLGGSEGMLPHKN